jgi:hypothetical protein
LASQINASNSGFGGIVSTGDSSGVLQLQTAGTAALTIDTSQNVGIGVTPSAWNSRGKAIQLGNGSINTSLFSLNSGLNGLANNTYVAASTDNYIANGEASRYYQYAGTHVWDTATSGTAGNTITFTERMRIDSSGTLLVGQTTNPATGTVVIKIPNPSGNGVNAQMASNTGTAYPWSNYNASGTYVGGMTSTSSATGFPTSSDKRLKKNIVSAPSAIDKILTTQVVSHDWINDDAHVEYGFVAQDLQSIIPQAVMEGTDKEDGSINMPWGVDYSKIVPLLVKAIQEQQAIINDLKARVETLEAK